MADHVPPTTVIARRIALGSASNAVGRVVALVTWFALTPFILDRLGPAGYGLWVLVGSVTAYGYLLDLGIGGAVVKYVAEHRVDGDWGTASSLVAAGLRLYLALAGVTVVLGLLAAMVIPRLLGLDPATADIAGSAIALAGVSVAVGLVFVPAMSVLRGLQRHGLYNLVTISGTLLSAAATVVVLLAGGGVVAMVAVSIPATLVTQLWAVACVRRIAPDLRFGWRGGGASERRRLARFSAPLLAMNLSRTAQTRTDEIVIAAVLPIAAVTPYALARRLAELLLVASDQFVKVLLPVASELDAARDRERMRTLYVLSVRITLVLLVPFAILLVLFGGPILRAWVGPEHDGAGVLVAILAVAGVFRGASWPAASILQGMARHGWVAVLSVASGIANIVLSLLLVRELGVIGVAYGTLIPTAIEALVLVPYGMRVTGVGIGDGLRRTVLPPLLPAVPMTAFLVLFDAWIRPEGAALIAAAALGCAIYGSVYWGLSATRTERDLVESILRSAVGAARADAR
jgi:O-antigen/teichoic acid export membrane protein